MSSCPGDEFISNIDRMVALVIKMYWRDLVRVYDIQANLLICISRDFALCYGTYKCIHARFGERLRDSVNILKTYSRDLVTSRKTRNY